VIGTLAPEVRSARVIRRLLIFVAGNEYLRSAA
jgi:hypothetical protein